MENTHNNNKSPPRSSPNLSPLKIEFKNPIVTNKSTLATSSSPTSSDLSPLSSHDDNPPPSDSPLCHVSPSPDPAGEEKTKKPSVITEGEFRLARSLSSASSELSPLSSLGHENNNPPPLDSPPYHVSPSPGPKVRQFLSVARAEKREKTVKRAALGFRVFGLGFCLVSLAVMAADKDRGWALDSFYRYKEFRYCISVNVVGFLYSVAQTCDLAFTLCTGKYVLRHQYRFYFDFVMDQILTYLLMSASSSAATRVDDWESNWGKDEFPMMASISVGLSFMSFAALAASTLISGYALCTWSSS